MEWTDILLIYLMAVNVILYAMMGIDKFNAKMQRRRIPERVLFTFAAIGGGLGGTLGMFSFRHKTKHWYFRLFFPLLMLIQIALVIWMTQYR